MTSRLTVALPKGRLLDDALELIRELGVDGVDQDSRRLIFDDARRGLRLLFLKPADVPAYVTYGAAQLGIVGKDISPGAGAGRLRAARPRLRLLPAGGRRAARAVGARRSRQVVVGPRGHQVSAASPSSTSPRAVSRWSWCVWTARSSWPAGGLAERIVDLVQSGETLRANGLVEVAEIARSTARLIVNRAAMKTEYAAITELIGSLRGRSHDRTSIGPPAS
jgi:ATP phosphoribosyltransferase